MLIFMDLPADVPTQRRRRRRANEQRRRETQLKAASVCLVISRPLSLRAELNPENPGTALALLAQILRRKPLLAVIRGSENESERRRIQISVTVTRYRRGGSGGSSQSSQNPLGLVGGLQTELRPRRRVQIAACARRNFNSVYRRSAGNEKQNLSGVFSCGKVAAAVSDLLPPAKRLRRVLRSLDDDSRQIPQIHVKV